MSFDVTHEYRRTIADRVDALDALFGTIDVPFVILGPTGGILFFSRQASNLLALSMDEIGRPLFPQTAETATAARAIAFAAGTRTPTSETITIDGTATYIQQTRPILDEEDNHKGTLVTFMDAGSRMQSDRRTDNLLETCRHVFSAEQVFLLRFDTRGHIVYRNFRRRWVSRETELRLRRRASEVIRSGESVDLHTQSFRWNLIPEIDDYGRSTSVLVVGTEIDLAAFEPER
jgi:hypothetical protein